MQRSVLILTLILLSATITPVFAASPSPTALPVTTQDSEATESVKQNIKERVEKIRQTTDAEVKGMMEALKSEKFGIIGTLEKIVGSSLQVRSWRGALRVIELDKSATLLKGKTTVVKDDLELNSPVILMGLRDRDNTLIGKRLLLTDESIFPTKRTTIYGKLSAITTKDLTLTSRKDGSMQPVTVKLATKTVYLNSIDGVMKRTDNKPGDPLIVVLPPEVTATVSAIRVYNLAPHAIATPAPLP